MKSLTLTPKPLIQRPSVNDVYDGQYWIIEHKKNKNRRIVLCSHIRVPGGERRFIEFGSDEHTSIDTSNFDFIKEINLYGVT